MSSGLARLKQSVESLEVILGQFSDGLLPSRLDSWSTFIESRKLTEWIQQDTALRPVLLSEVLTYPMTLAKYLRDHNSSVSRIHVVGARAEATLPQIYWTQLLREVEVPDINVDFYGPDIPDKINGKSEVITAGAGGRTITRSFHKTLYDVCKAGTPQLIVLFNPGLSHQRLQRTWKPTLDLIIDSKLPVLITGLNEQDAINDYQLLQLHTISPSRVMRPIINPLACLREYSEGINGRIARANAFAWKWDS